MNSFDPMAVQALRDAQRYSDLCNEADRREQIAAEEDAQTNRVLSAIRKCDLTHAQVHQILVTLACEMKRAGHSEIAIAAVEEASDV